MVLFICVKPCLCHSSCIRSQGKMKWNTLLECPLPSFFFTSPFLCSAFLSLVPFIMCRDAWVMKSSLSVWPAHLCLSLLPLIQPLCSSMLIWPTNSVQVWQTRALLNSGQTASSVSLLAACDSASAARVLTLPFSSLWCSLSLFSLFLI